MAKTRTRRTAAASRLAILEAAERRLVAEGPAGVRVQPIAAELGLTDAAIHYHFGNRQALLEALLAHAGRRLADDLAAATAAWDAGSFDLAAFSSALREVFVDRGAAWLLLWLRQSGWRPAGAGMMSQAVEHLHAARVARAKAAGRKPPPLQDSRFILALLTSVAFLEPVAADAILRSVGEDSDVAAFAHWVEGLLVDRLERGP